MSLKSKLQKNRIKSGLILLISLFLGAQIASAQIDNEGWGQPVNVSKSGATSNPIMVSDASSILYAFWKNSVDGYFVSINGAGEWGNPINGNFPFATRAYTVDLPPGAPTPLYDPSIAADRQSGLHAFWIDSEETLRYSRFAGSGNIWSLQSWTAPSNLDNDVVKVVATTSLNNQLHVVYIRRAGIGVSSGLYHRASSDRGLSWSESRQIYSSSFFSQASAESFHIEFFESGGQLSLVWDDVFTEQVFYSSFDPSGAWLKPAIIDRRQESDSASSTGPNDIHGAASGGEQFLFWIAGHDDEACSLYWRKSADQGETWTFPEKLTNNVNDCPNSFDVIEDNGRLILFTSTALNDEIRYFENGGWSQTSDQAGLSIFKDPVSFRDVRSTCPYQFSSHLGSLVALGCGSGVTEDVWAFSIPLSDLASPENVVSTWTESSQILANDKAVFAPELVADASGNMHAFWVQSGQGFSDKPTIRQPGESIYYAIGNGNQWSAPTDVLAASGDNSNPAVAFYPKNDSLMVVWEDRTNQQLLFSKVATAQAVNWRDWSENIVIPAPFANPSYPDIAVTSDGMILVSYAVPYNEDQGVYIVYSKDEGDTWSDPISILDIENAWDIIIDPQIVIAENDRLHFSFLNQLAATDAIQNELYYQFLDITNLEEKEIESTLPKLIQNQLLENNNILSYKLDKDERSSVAHLVWQEWNDTQPNLWAQTIWGAGNQSSDPVQLSGFGFPIGNLSMNHDSDKGLHLNQVFLETIAGRSELSIHGWFYDVSQNGWVPEGSTVVEEVDFNPSNIVMMSGINTQDVQNVLFSGSIVVEGRPEQGLFYVSRKIENKPVAGATGSENEESNGGQVEQASPTAETASPTAVGEASEDDAEEIVIPPKTLTEEQKVEVESSAFTLFTSSNMIVSSGILALLLTGFILLMIGGYYVINFFRN